MVELVGADMFLGESNPNIVLLGETRVHYTVHFSNWSDRSTCLDTVLHHTSVMTITATGPV